MVQGRGGVGGGWWWLVVMVVSGLQLPLKESCLAVFRLHGGLPKAFCSRPAAEVGEAAPAVAPGALDALSEEGGLRGLSRRRSQEGLHTLMVDSSAPGSPQVLQPAGTGSAFKRRD